MAETTIGPITSAATAGTTTPAGGVITEIDNLPLEHVSQISIRLEVTTGITGTAPVCDIYIQRATQSAPGADDWDDWYAFPQFNTSAVDFVVHGPLALPADVDGSLGSASHAVVQEALAADVLLAGLIGHQLRIREKVGGTGLTAAVYNIHIVAK